MIDQNLSLAAPNRARTARSKRKIATWLRTVLVLLAIPVVGLGVAGCSDKQSSAPKDGSLPTVAVASYALAFVVHEVGGDEVNIEDLSTTSGHAHNLELSPAQAQRLGNADLVLYLSQGFQPAVESAVQQAGVPSIDGLEAVSASDLIPGDAHIWLDPILVSEVGEEVANVLAEANPTAADYYRANASDLTERLLEVDKTYAQALEDCQGTTLLTTHEAFGYMAQRYGLNQIGVTGIDPEAEPSPARLRELQALVDEYDVTTLYVEPLTSGHHEQHLNETLGVTSLPLDTIEVQTDPDADLIDVYYTNLDSLREGLRCAK